MRMEKCGWKNADGKIADGKMRMEKCGWKDVDGKMRMEKCGWKNADNKTRIHIWSSAFFHPHFIIRILSSAAIRSALYRVPFLPCLIVLILQNGKWFLLVGGVDFSVGFAV